MIHKFMQNWSCTPPCGHSTIKFGGHVKLRLRIHFSYLTQPSVSKRYSFINLCAHPSPFQAFEKTFIAFTLVVYTHIFFFQKPLVFWSMNFFSKKNWQLFLFKACWLFSQKNIFFVFVCCCLLFFLAIFSINFLKQKIKNSLQPGHGWYLRFTTHQKGMRMKDTRLLFLEFLTNHHSVCTTIC